MLVLHLTYRALQHHRRQYSPFRCIRMVRRYQVSLFPSSSVAYMLTCASLFYIPGSASSWSCRACLISRRNCDRSLHHRLPRPEDDDGTSSSSLPHIHPILIVFHQIFGLLAQAIIGFIMSGLYSPLKKHIGAFAVSRALDSNYYPYLNGYRLSTVSF